MMKFKVLENQDPSYSCRDMHNNPKYVPPNNFHAFMMSIVINITLCDQFVTMRIYHISVGEKKKV